MYLSYAAKDIRAQDSLSGLQPAEVQDAPGCSGVDRGPYTPGWSTTEVSGVL